MKKALLSFVAVALFAGAMAQNTQTAHPQQDATVARRIDQDPNAKQNLAEKRQEKKFLDKVQIKPYGFVRNYFNYDSRNTYTVIGGEYNMIPYDEKWSMTDAEVAASGLERTDLNATPKAQMLAITTRFGLNLNGPAVLGAATSGKIEADFGGFGTTNSVLRIRQAWMKLNWEDSESGLKQELLAGQTWHPLSGEIMPECLGMAVGAPFRAHSRTPQLRYIFTDGQFGFTAAALYQLQYMYNGPTDGANWASTNSTSFANNAIVPELFLGVQFKNKNIYTQLGSTMQTIKPRTFGLAYKGGNPYKVAVDERMVSFTPTFYFQYTESLFSAKFRAIYANNTSHVNQINGYAVTAYDTVSGQWEYAPLRAAITYLDLAYGKKYRANLFLGYQKNLGAAADLYNFGTDAKPAYNIYMKGGSNFTKLNTIWRVAPSLSYNLPHFNFGIEYELTGCTYGDIAKNGSIEMNDNLHQVVNHRVCCLIKYNF